MAWQLKNKGPKFTSAYVDDGQGGRAIVLVAIVKGKAKTYIAESWQALKKLGWAIVA